MSAKSSDLARIQEVHDVIVCTRTQMKELGFTKARFLQPVSTEDDLIAEGILNRALRVAEEAGHLSDEVAERYGFARHAVRGVRNRLAHAYGEVNREIVWAVIEQDFDELLRACRAFCDDEGIDIE